MKSILISSDRSNGGKTSLTLCIMRALMIKGLKVQGFKCGPDYIDTGFHSIITGIKSRNLDEFLQGKDVFLGSLCKSLGDINVIEGVMGFYDGDKDGNYSANDVSNKLNIPTILILNPKGQALTFCATLKGLLEYKKNTIKGIILNMVSQPYFDLINSFVKKDFPHIEVLGYMPKIKELEFSSRHLGLIQGMEIDDLNSRIETAAHELIKHVNLDRLIEISKGNQKEVINKEESLESKNICYESSTNKVIVEDRNKLTLCYAKDEAFSFYYEDSLEELRKQFNLVEFSPLKSKILPPCQFLYLGGGYPEVFKEELSKNTSLLKDIKEKLENGLPCYAECGGLMYLTDSIDNYKMVGFLEGRVEMTTKLQHFGYCNVESMDDELPKFNIPSHEFHKSIFLTPLKEVTRVKKLGKDKEWQGGYFKNNTFAQYAHINLANAKILVNFFIDKAIAYLNNNK